MNELIVSAFSNPIRPKEGPVTMRVSLPCGCSTTITFKHMDVFGNVNMLAKGFCRIESEHCDHCKSCKVQTPGAVLVRLSSEETKV